MKRKRSERSERSPKGAQPKAGRTEGKGWKEIPIAGIIDKGGTAREYKTGSWRTFKPVVDKSKCINCLQCWIYCPDSSIVVKDGKMEGFDYDYCKGCGICASVCPVKCIKMEKEAT
ncbi:MAG: 4Fe-4S binding protein [Candidatus Omnitrophota bacterium]|nr:MAG: 4Fe-4S binding protein [Candidatus Omnitrophota bacterium]